MTESTAVWACHHRTDGFSILVPYDDEEEAARLEQKESAVWDSERENTQFEVTLWYWGGDSSAFATKEK